MVEESKTEEKNDIVDVSDDKNSETPKSSEVETKEDGKVTVPEVSNDEIKIGLSQLENLIFKVGNLFFKVNYVNVGKKRFTAELINDLKQ